MTDKRTTGADTVSGIVETILFQNEENGYTVAEIEDTAGNPVTLAGIIPFLTESDRITAHGEWVNHPTYGRQFRVDAFEKTLPAEEGDILRYLGSGAIKGIGPKTAQKIVEKFGADSFDVISDHPDWLAEIPGITQKKAADISEQFKTMSGTRAVMMFCRDFFTPQTAMKIYKRWGSSAVERIRQNPYRLCEDFWGISFRRADQIAMSLGMEQDSSERLLQGAVYVLRTEAARSGHTCLPYDDLVSCMNDLLFGDSVTAANRQTVAAAVEKALVFEAASTSGGIRMEAAECREAKANSTSGDISVSLGKLEKLRIDATSGSVTAALPEAPGFTAEVHTTSGDFSSGIALARDGDRYTCGDGSAGVAIGTTSGNVRLEKAEK